MQISWIPIQDIRPYENNPRKNKKTVEKLMQSLKEYGWQQPIVVDRDGVIVVGHARWQAAIKLGMDTVPVHRASDLNEAQIKSYRLADNRVAEESSWDAAALSAELKALQADQIDLSVIGFSEKDLKSLLQEVPVCPPLDTGTPNSDSVVSQPGDIWQLGHHRLMCGDATEPFQVSQLMAGQTANLVFTDPPYNVDYQGNSSHHLYKQSKKRPLHNDNLPKEAYLSFLKAAFTQIALHSEPEASLYICYADQYVADIASLLESTEFEVQAVLIWAKQHFVLNYSRYKTQHEPILYVHRQGHVGRWYGDRHQTTLWRIDRPNHNALHPTTKPIALIEKALWNSSLPGDRVLDLFGGSGSTLIACELQHRLAYVMEIMPNYVDVIIKRWQSYTNQSAILLANGFTFEAVQDCRVS